MTGMQVAADGQASLTSGNDAAATSGAATGAVERDARGELPPTHPVALFCGGRLQGAAAPWRTVVARCWQIEFGHPPVPPLRAAAALRQG